MTALHRELQEARVPDVDFASVNAYANDLAVAAFIRKMLALLLMENDLVAKNISAALTKLAAFAQNGDANAAEHVNLFSRILQDYQNHSATTTAGLAKSITAPLETLTRPTTLVLTQNYPDPFNPATTIRFRLSERQKVRLMILDITGQRVRTLAEGELSAGEQTLSWDGRDQQGRLVASGVYFYELVTNNKVERRKMTLIR